MRHEILWITLDHKTNLTNSQTIDRVDWPPFLETFIEEIMPSRHKKHIWILKYQYFIKITP
jgi:hypothetical protein